MGSVYSTGAVLPIMSVKEKLLRIKEHLDNEDFSSGLEACEALVCSAGGVSSLPPPAQFPVCSSYGLCALRVGKMELAEEYCSKADALEAPPAQIQKNLKVIVYSMSYAVSLPL